eukprot:163925-Chlamydomonas_euryale.AAC.1
MSSPPACRAVLRHVPQGKWTVPAGFMELNESTAEGAVRETLEEANAKVWGRCGRGRPRPGCRPQGTCNPAGRWQPPLMPRTTMGGVAATVDASSNHGRGGRHP